MRLHGTCRRQDAEHKPQAERTRSDRFIMTKHVDLLLFVCVCCLDTENGEMMKVTTRSGRTVETTTSHSHLVRGENHKVVPIVGANMKEYLKL